MALCPLPPGVISRPPAPHLPFCKQIAPLRPTLYAPRTPRTPRATSSMAYVPGSIQCVKGLAQVGPTVAAFIGLGTSIYYFNRYLAPYAHHPTSTTPEFVAAMGKYHLASVSQTGGRAGRAAGFGLPAGRQPADVMPGALGPLPSCHPFRAHKTLVWVQWGVCNARRAAAPSVTDAHCCPA